MLDTVNSLLSATMLALAAFGVGRPLLRRLRLGEDDALVVAVWSLALGMMAWGLGLTALGLMHGLYRPPIGVATWAAAFWGVAELVREPQRTTPSSDDNAAAAPRRWRLSPLALGVGTFALFPALATLGALVAALAPPTAGDALCYHLELPKVFLAEHALVHLPYSDNSTFPLLVEIWFLWGLALDGPVAAQLVHWLLGVLFALSAAVLAGPVLGHRWRWAVAAVVVLVPGVSNQMTAPLNDVGLALLTTLALAAWLQAAIYEESPRWHLVAGLMLGGALGTKYSALLFIAALAAAALWVILRQPRRRRELLVGCATTMLVAASVAGVWYARAAWHRGNPVYPFFAAHVGEAGPDGDADKTALLWHPWDVLTAPWQVTMHAERFGGRGHQLGPLFLMALPGLCLARRLRGLGILLAIAAAYGALWYALRQNVRFLLPLVPLLGVGAVWMATELRRFPRAARVTAAVALAMPVLLGGALPLKRARDKLAVAVGLESRDEYLARVEPTHQAAAALRSDGVVRPRLLSQDYRAFYFPCDVVRESIYRRRTDYAAAVRAPGDFNRVLRAAGFTHLLLVEAIADEGAQFDDTLSRLADAQRAAERPLPPEKRTLAVVTEYRFADSDGGVRRYRLVEIR